MIIRNLLIIVLLGISTAHAQSSLDADATSAKKSGDILQWAIPLLGWGLTYLLDRQNDVHDDFTAPINEASINAVSAPGLNWPGPRLSGSPRSDFIKSFVRMEVSTYALKYAINARRPNGGKHSFPSGHAASAFMGAEFIRKNYGLMWGIPAYAAAGWVGYSRVESNNHYWRDVIAGAVIGVAANYDFGKFNTPAGQLVVGPVLLTQPAAGSCNQAEYHRCFNNKPAITPGLGFELRF